MTRPNKRRRNMKIIGHNGPPCHRCNRPTEIREHIQVTERELAKSSYYSRWFKCTNRDCTTTMIMPAEFIVRNERGAKDDTMKVSP